MVKQVHCKARRPRSVWTKQRKEHRQDLARMLRACLINGYSGGYCQWDITQGKKAEGKQCNVNDPDVLQFAHVHGKETELKGSGRGQYYRLKDVFDHPDCYVLLCADHHREYDKSK